MSTNIKISGHTVIQPFFYDYLIVRCDKGEGLGYKEYRIYDVPKREFVHYKTKNKGAIYGKTIDDVVKEFKLVMGIGKVVDDYIINKGDEKTWDSIIFKG